jgi:hypothetical protein
VHPNVFRLLPCLLYEINGEIEVELAANRRVPDEMVMGQLAVSQHTKGRDTPQKKPQQVVVKKQDLQSSQNALIFQQHVRFRLTKPESNL